MKVLSLQEVGNICLENREIPSPKEDEVLLEIKACGICSSDEDRIFKTGTYEFPTVPGHEFAGRIVEVGENVDAKLIGRKASVFPLLPCFECESCKNHQFATCSNYKYFGSRNDGAFAEYLAVPEWNINLLDESVSFEVAALSEPCAVAYHAVVKGAVAEHDEIAVIGTGAIGILVAAICKQFGAHPVVVGRRKESVKMVKSFDLDAVTTDELESKGCYENADVVFEVVGSNQAIETAINTVRANGRVVAVGNPHEDLHLEKRVYWKILRKQITLYGTWNSSFKGYEDDWAAVSQMMKSACFPFEKLITETYTLDQYSAAFERLKDKSRAKTRLMFVMNGEKENG